MKLPLLQIGPRPRRGFTLIELMIAIGLGAAIIYTAFAGVRVAAQSSTVANRLSLENSLMRAGYFMAVEDADFWISYDDPDDQTTGKEHQRLRSFNGDPKWRRGLPFTPFNGSVFPRAGGIGTEQERGWNPAFSWPASDPRTWFHGNMVEQIWSTQRVFGNYELFCHFKNSASLTKTFPNGKPYGTVVPLHTWYCNQLESLKNAMGYYGACEYMPANAIYGVVGEPGADNTFGSGSGADADDDQRLEAEWASPEGSGGGVQWRFTNDDGGGGWVEGLYRRTRDSSYTIIPSSVYTKARTDEWDVPTLVAQHARCWATDRVSQAAETSPGNHGLVDFTNKALMTEPVLATHPQHWPDLKVAVMRYCNNCRFVSLCKVRWTSPLTGEQVELSFSLLCTSLRGARQQRSPSGGWAKPGEPNLDSP